MDRVRDCRKVAPMRPAPPNFDPRIWARLEEARELLRQGDVAAALDGYTSTWCECVAASDHLHASVIAHMAGVAEPDIVKKHEWNLRAISQADQVADRSLVNDVYASNLNNLGLSYAQLGDQRKAMEIFEAALRAVDDLQPGPYRDQVRAGIERNLARAIFDGGQCRRTRPVKA